MATIEFYDKRLAGKYKQLEKLNAKLERITKAKESNWTINPYYYQEYDLHAATQEISFVQTDIETLKQQLDNAQQLARSRNVKKILDWLDVRKTYIKNWYEKELCNGYICKQEIKRLADEAHKARFRNYQVYTDINNAYTNLYRIYRENVCGKFRDLTDEEKTMPMYRYTHHIKIETGKWEYISQYLGFDSIDVARAKIDKDLYDWANGVYDDLIRRVTKVVGEITDASCLETNEKGGIDGIIKGAKCNANVHTISAEGDIQCFHYRTLVKPIKEPKKKQ